MIDFLFKLYADNWKLIQFFEKLLTVSRKVSYNKEEYSIGALKMLNINIVCVGKIKENYLKSAIDEYSKWLSKYCNLKIVELADEKLPGKLYDSALAETKEKECRKIIDNIKKDSYVICLDLKGKELTSEQFSKKIEDISLNFNSTITFVIGGTLGLTEEVLQMSNEKLCFSKMTFPHQLIRVFLLEQIFRAFKISKNETYHW